MKKFLPLLSFSLPALLLVPHFAFAQVTAAQDENASPKAHIRVDLGQQKAPVSPELYGIFLEEISHAFDGGLYGELIQNRSFEEGVLPPGLKLVKKDDGTLKMELEKLPPGVPKDKWDMPWPWFMGMGWDTKRETLGWSLQNEGGAQGEMKITAENPMNAASSRSLALTVNAPDANAPTSRVALVNSGYWGISVQAGAVYQAEFHLRPGTFAGSVAASLENEKGQVLASFDCGKVKPGTKWQLFKATLKASGSEAKARFVLSLRGAGALQVDWVSLFGPTYKNRLGGLRPDLAQYLEDYKPAFVRYPGGCYVEGYSWEQAPDWRKMVTTPRERPGQWGYWGYRSTDGFGYHEFLQFCEDVKADAMYVAFAGMTVHPENNVPLGEIEPVIQQTLDAIEYAIGPTKSKWGAVRAKMGHPKPFPLKYIEIGNEHPPAIYGDYYAKFRQAIKAKYPQITVIMSMFWSGLNQGAIDRAGDANIDMVDEHSYKPSGWIRNNFDYFDKYKRKGWDVYVGEYAHHHNAGDWSAALDDSVYLMMLERNGDLVKMASYAPLFANVNKRDWGVNLIEFDSARSFAHASYYVQKLFNETRPTVNLATQVEITPKPDPVRPQMAGKFGLGAWNTQTEFKELRIYDEAGKLILSDDFANLDQWQTPAVGKWQAQDGVLRQSENGHSPAQLLLKNFEFKTGKVTLKARRVGGAEGFLMFFNASDINRFLFCNYGAAGNAFSAIQDRGQSDGVAFRGGKSTQGKIEDGRWYEISLVLGRDKAEMFLDGKLVSDARSEYLPPLFVNAGYDAKSKSIVLRATNYFKVPVRAEIQLDGAANLNGNAQHTVISSAKPDDENSLDNPRRIVPQEQPPLPVAPRMSITLPPLSVNVVKIPAQAK